MYGFGHCSGDLSDVFIDDFEEEFLTCEGSSSLDGAVGRDSVKEQGSSLMDGNSAVSGAMFVDSALTDTLDMDSLLTGPVDSDPSATHTKVTPKTQDAGTKRRPNEILDTGAQQSGDAVWNPQNYPYLQPPVFSDEKQHDRKIIWGPFGSGQSEPTSLHWSISGALVGMKRNSKSSSSDSGHYSPVQGGGSGSGDTPLLPATRASVQNCQALPAQHLLPADNSAPSGFAVFDDTSCSITSEMARHYGGSHCLSDPEETCGSTEERALKLQKMLCKSLKLLQIEERPQLPMTQEPMNSAREPHRHLDSQTQFQRCSDKSSAQWERSMEPATKHERSLNLSSQLEKSPEPILRPQEPLSPPQRQRSLQPSLQHKGRPGDSLVSPVKIADCATQKPDFLPATPTELALDGDIDNSMSSLDSGSSWLMNQKLMISEASKLTHLKCRTRGMKTVEEGTQQVEGSILAPVSQPDVLVKAGPCSTNAATANLPGDLGQGVVQKRKMILPTTGLPELSPSLQESCLSWERKKCLIEQTSAQSLDDRKASSDTPNINRQRSGVKMPAGSNIGAQMKPGLPAPDSQPQACFTRPNITHKTCEVNPSNPDIGCKTPRLSEKAPDIYRSTVAKQKVSDICQREMNVTDDSERRKGVSYATPEVCQETPSVNLMPGHGRTPPDTGPHLESEHSPSSGKQTDSAMLATPPPSRHTSLKQFTDHDQSSCSSSFTAGSACRHARNSHSLPSRSRSRNEPQPACNLHSWPMSCVPPQATRSPKLRTDGVPRLTSNEGGHRTSSLPHQADTDFDHSTSGALRRASNDLDTRTTSSASHRASNDLGHPMTKAFPRASNDFDPVSKSIHRVSSDGGLPSASAHDGAGIDLDLPTSNAPDHGSSPFTEHRVSSAWELSMNSVHEQFGNVSDESHVSSGLDSSMCRNVVRGSGEGVLHDPHEHCVHGTQEQVPGGRGQHAGDDGSASGPGTGDSDGTRSRPSYDLQKSVTSTVSFNTPSSLLRHSLINDCSPLLPVQAQTWMEMNADKDHFVRTTVLEEAQDTLDTFSVVLIVGPPHSGKTTLARALLRCADHKVQKCCSITSASEWRQTVESGQPLRVVLDDVFGRTKMKDVEVWKPTLDGMEESRKQGTLQLVVTISPPVLKSLRLALPRCDLFSPVHEVSVGPLMADEKRRMFKRILQDRVNPSAVSCLVTNARCLQQGQQYECSQQGLQEASQEKEDWEKLLSILLESVIMYDESGAMFPDACRWFATTLNRYDGRPLWQYLESGMKIFSRPSPLYKEVVLQLLQDQDINTEELMAVLCLLLDEVDVTDDNNTDIIAGKCCSLGFSSACSFIGLQSVLQVLTSVLVEEGSARFINRHAYCGTALALGQNNLTMTVKVVDWPFLVQRCKVTGEDASRSQTDDNLKPFQLEIQRLKSNRKVSPEYEALVRRLAEGLANNRVMVLAVQHPVLQAVGFMKDLKAFYNKQSENDVKRIFSQTYDSIHEMSLLYWSVFNPDCFLFEWIFKTVIGELKGRFCKEELVKAAYLCCVLRDKAHFLEKLLKYWRKATSDDVRELLYGQHLHSQAPPFRLPLPKSKACLCDCWQDQQKHIKAVYSSPTSLQRGGTAEASPSEIKSGRSAPCSAYAVDGKPQKQKQKSLTKGINISSAPLLVAVEFNNEGVVDLLMKTYTNTLTVQDGEERTALHVAVHCGHLHMVRKLMGHRELLELMDREGDTEIAELLLAAEEGWKEEKEGE